MPHRGFQNSQVRCCRLCYKFIEVKLVHSKPLDLNSNLPVPSHVFTIGSSKFASRRLAPEDLVMAGSMLNKALRKFEGLMVPTNEIIPFGKDNNAQDSTSEVPSNFSMFPGFHRKETASQYGARVTKKLSIPTGAMSELHHLPAPSSVHIPEVVALLALDPTINTLTLSTSYPRLRDSVQATHKIAVDAQSVLERGIVRSFEY